MSLRDRFNTTAQRPKTDKSIKKQQIAPALNYKKPSSAPKSDFSLGILETLLSQDDISAIYVNGAKNIYVEKRGRVYKAPVTFIDDNQLETLIIKNAQERNIPIDALNPYIKFNYKNGVNVCAMLPPLSNQISMTIKCYRDKYASLQLFQEKRIASKEIALVLEALASIRCNVLIAGKRNTFKTTLLSAIAKKVPSCDRAALFDNQNELGEFNKNFVTYDLSSIEDNIFKKQLINSVADSNPDRIFVNDNNQEYLPYFISKLADGYKGLCATITASSPKAAVNKFAQMMADENPALDNKTILNEVQNALDLIIMLDYDIETSSCKITSVSQCEIIENDNFVIKDIFYLNYLKEYCSSGIVPKFYQEIQNNSVSVGVNIFDENYKHTTYKTYNEDVLSKFGKKSKDDILKKFKKELPNENENKNENENENENKQTNKELMRKAQEKFDELKKNIQAQKQENNSDNSSVELMEFNSAENEVQNSNKDDNLAQNEVQEAQTSEPSAKTDETAIDEQADENL